MAKACCWPFHWSMITKMLVWLSVAQGPCSTVLPTVHGCHYAFQKFPFFGVILCVYIYVYIYTYTHLFNSEIVLQWDSKYFKVIFEISHIHISVQKSLLFMKVQVFCTPWGKCRDTGIIQNCNVTDSFHNFSSSPIVQELGSAAE